MYKRSTVIQLLKKSFDYTAKNDYAKGFALYEEDVRSCIYFNVRRALDFDSNWRIFCNTNMSINAIAKRYKPDMIVFHSNDNHENEKIEVLVEIKHWPSFDDVNNDIVKLQLLRYYCGSDNPDIIFISIVGNNKDGIELNERVNELKDKYPDVHLWLKNHECLYQGPYDNTAKNDPWRKRLLEINQQFINQH